jgi:hypothetical protein
MKKALAVVLVAACIGVFAGAAMAQVPFVQVFFDADVFGEGYSVTQSDCLPPNTISDLNVVAMNWNMFIQAIDFKVIIPPALLYLSDTPNTTIADPVIGNSPSGMAIAYNIPRNGFSPLLLTTIRVLWTGACNCAAGPQAIVVTGFDPSVNPNPQAVRWPDFVQLDGVGMTSLICPGPVSTQSSTWGGVKALYR